MRSPQGAWPLCLEASSGSGRGCGRSSAEAMGDDFNFFLPDELLNDSDSDGERENAVPPASELVRLPEGFVPRGGINAPDFIDAGSGYPSQSRLLNNLRPAASSHRWVPPLSLSLCFPVDPRLSLLQLLLCLQLAARPRPRWLQRLCLHDHRSQRL